MILTKRFSDNDPRKNDPCEKDPCKKRFFSEKDVEKSAQAMGYDSASAAINVHPMDPHKK